MKETLFVWLQYLLPRAWLTAAVFRLARVRTRWVKDALIRGFIRMFDVDLAEVSQEVPRDFRTFNEFFTRELAPGARPIDADDDAIVAPVDGTVSAAAAIDENLIFQAKGIDYTLEDLLAADIDKADAFQNGRFATIYLAPYNYHRIHMPLDGRLLAAHYVPGDLFSVNAATVSRVAGLFHRNERLNLHFDTSIGPVVVIFVGALNVGSITTPWTGEIRPRKRGVVENRDLGRVSRELKKGDLLGWFNMGSTVIVLLPENGGEWQATLRPGETVRMGEAIGRMPADRS